MWGFKRMPAQSKSSKRKRGGQHGNQNARKHGFYSSTLSPDEICRFWNIVNQESVDPEMAVLRIKLQSLIQYAPIDCRTLKEVTRLIVKWSADKYRKAIGREAMVLREANVYFTSVELHRSKCKAVKVKCTEIR